MPKKRVLPEDLNDEMSNSKTVVVKRGRPKKARVEEVNMFDLLPDELIIEVLEKLHNICNSNYFYYLTQAVCKRWQFISSDKSLWDEVKISGAKGNAWLTKRCLMRLESPLKHATCLKLGNVPIRNEHILKLRYQNFTELTLFDFLFEHMNTWLHLFSVMIIQKFSIIYNSRMLTMYHEFQSKLFNCLGHNLLALQLMGIDIRGKMIITYIRNSCPLLENLVLSLVGIDACHVIDARQLHHLKNLKSLRIGNCLNFGPDNVSLACLKASSRYSLSLPFQYLQTISLAPDTSAYDIPSSWNTYTILPAYLPYTLPLRHPNT